MAIPDIIVQVKGQNSTAVVSHTPLASRLVDLLDVDRSTVQDGYVLVWSAANSKFQFQVIDGGIF